MSDVTVRLDSEDRSAIVKELASVVKVELREIRSLLAQPDGMFQGIQLVTAAEVAEDMAKSPRQLYRMESAGQLPRRRQISRRKTAYFAHELEKLPPEAVMVRDQRTISRPKLARKLGLDKRTITAMVKSGELPEPIDGRWFVSDIDRWLLSRPQV